mmetsp:Transcript_3870/g.9416  ORF Transcript_3870/g.9416 Transcript_3870/m.9416 type:complete len:234 (+) Transcript_3870:2102-2803(+)
MGTRVTTACTSSRTPTATTSAGRFASLTRLRRVRENPTASAASPCTPTPSATASPVCAARTQAATRTTRCASWGVSTFPSSAPARAPAASPPTPTWGRCATATGPLTSSRTAPTRRRCSSRWNKTSPRRTWTSTACWWTTSRGSGAFTAAGPRFPQAPRTAPRGRCCCTTTRGTCGSAATTTTTGIIGGSWARRRASRSAPWRRGPRVLSGTNSWSTTPSWSRRWRTGSSANR